MTAMKTLAAVVTSAAIGAGVMSLWDRELPQSFSDVGTCDAPSGAMDAIRYQEIFLGELHEIKFGCISRVRGICSVYPCTEFTAIDSDNKHVIGYAWRDVFNRPRATNCSPDGVKAGTFYGEYPVGTTVATVYSCPWCLPNINAVANTRGKH